MRRNYSILVYCWVLPLYRTFYLTSSPIPTPSQWTVYTDNMWVGGGVGGGVEMYSGPYSAGVLHSVSGQIRNLQNCFTAPNKMTSEDDIKGLVSLTSFVHEYTECALCYRVILGLFASSQLNMSLIKVLGLFVLYYCDGGRYISHQHECCWPAKSPIYSVQS